MPRTPCTRPPFDAVTWTMRGKQCVAIRSEGSPPGRKGAFPCGNPGGWETVAGGEPLESYVGPGGGGIAWRCRSPGGMGKQSADVDPAGGPAAKPALDGGPGAASAALTSVQKRYAGFGASAWESAPGPAQASPRRDAPPRLRNRVPDASTAVVVAPKGASSAAGRCGEDTRRRAGARDDSRSRPRADPPTVGGSGDGRTADPGPPAAITPTGSHLSRDPAGRGDPTPVRCARQCHIE